jgi:hypothetical protein
MIDTSCFGFYEYRGQVFLDKTTVLEAAVDNNDLNPHIHFNFNDSIFKSIDWQVEPDINLADLYRMRAQQLRDSYDHLILMYTGGSDSRQVLHTFLDNNIFLDQVITIYPEKLTEKIKVSWDIYHPDAFLFEHELTTLPGLKDLHARSPKTQIQIVDCSNELMTFYHKDNYWADRRPLSRLGGTFHCTKMNAGIQYVRENTEKLGKVAVIWGCDKPNVMLHQGMLYGYFVDTGFNGSQVLRPTNVVDFSPVMFFSAADAPLITIKQCHVIKSWLERVPGIYKIFEKWGDNPSAWAAGRELTKHMIYPSWHHSIFQGDKSGHWKFDDCKNFTDRIDPRIYQSQNSRKKSSGKKFKQLKAFSAEHNYLLNAAGTKYRVGTVKPPLSRR